MFRSRIIRPVFSQFSKRDPYLCPSTILIQWKLYWSFEWDAVEARNESFGFIFWKLKIDGSKGRHQQIMWHKSYTRPKWSVEFQNWLRSGGCFEPKRVCLSSWIHLWTSVFQRQNHFIGISWDQRSNHSVWVSIRNSCELSARQGDWSLDCFAVVIKGVSDHDWTFDKTRNCIESKGIVIKWKYLCFSANSQSKWRCWNLDGNCFNLDWENMNQKWVSKNRSRDLLRSSHAQESLGPSNTSLLLPLWPLERSLNSVFGGIGKERSTP